MSGLLKKRSREFEASADSPKRFHGETKQQILHLLEDSDCLDKIQEEEEEYFASEELVSGFMRSLEEEIGLTLSVPEVRPEDSPGLSRDASMASDMTRGYGPADGLDYLLGASDDELGIPPSPLLNSDGQTAAAAPLREEDCGSFLDCADEDAEIKGFLDNWHFEDDFVDFRQFAVFDDAAGSAWDIVGQVASIDGDYSTPCRLEAAGGIY